MATHYSDLEELAARSRKLKPYKPFDYVSEDSVCSSNQWNSEDNLESRLKIAEERVRLLEDKLAKIQQILS
ncbi:MAG: hypothetical protein JHC38_03720 [Thiotrichales bacterium]|nr:hypothetical protein [Thiotrichales bacterium]